MIASSYEAKERVEVFISACDPISKDGIASQLRGHGVELVDERALHREVVALVVVEEIDEEATRQIRSLKLRGLERLVVIVTRVEDAGLLAAVEAGANGVLKRSQSTGPNLLQTVRTAAAGDGVLPPDLLGRLLGQVGRLQRQVLHPRGLTFAGLTDREVKVLKLLADGHDTAEVGRGLYLSERTVKDRKSVV
jgi:DNA-binding NarL/FixJ family response regulator